MFGKDRLVAAMSTRTGLEPLKPKARSLVEIDNFLKPTVVLKLLKFEDAISRRAISPPG